MCVCVCVHTSIQGVHSRRKEGMLHSVHTHIHVFMCVCVHVCVYACIQALKKHLAGAKKAFSTASAAHIRFATLCSHKCATIASARFTSAPSQSVGSHEPLTLSIVRPKANISVANVEPVLQRNCVNTDIQGSCNAKPHNVFHFKPCM